MQYLTIVAVFSPDGDKLLFCKRAKEPFKGLLNFPGGKAEPGENGIDCAYRELYEETGISREDIMLTAVMDFVYHATGVTLWVFAGKLKHDVTLKEEANSLVWNRLECDFADENLYAGHGNIAVLMKEMAAHNIIDGVKYAGI